MGYWQAGFQPVGLDIAPRAMLRYPFPKLVADLTELTPRDLRNICRKLGVAPPAAVHLSPPCPLYSGMRSITGHRDPNRPPPVNLILAARNLAHKTKLPYILENVEGARPYLHEPVKLCGSSHPWRLRIRRHRLFRVQRRAACS